MAHVVMTTHWTGGDIYPFIRIGQRLQQRGHRVTLITHCAYQAVAEKAGISFAAIDEPEEWTTFIEQDMPRRAHLLDTLSTVTSAAHQAEQDDDPELAYAKMRREYEIVKQHCQAAQTVLVARHTSSVAALLVAEELGIPLVSVFMAPALLSDVLMTELMVGERLVVDVNRLRARLGFAPIRSWKAWINAARYNIGLWPDWFAAPEPGWPVTAELVGFPLAAQEDPDLSNLPHEIQEMVRHGERPVLISGGTGKIVRSEFYSVCIEACRLLGCPTIVAAQYKELLPDPLPKHVKWFHYLSFEHVMPFMGALIHHGGIGTISQAMLAGIPQLVLAHGLDRPDNAFRLQRLGAAEALPLLKWKPELIAEALQRMLAPAARERSSVLAQRLHDADPLARAAEVIERAIFDQAALISSADFVASSGAQQRAEADTPLSVEAQSVNPPGRPDQPTKGTASDKVAHLSPEQLALLMRRLHQKKARD